LRASGVICLDCRVDGAFRAASATPQPTAPSLETGGSQRLREAAAAYLLGDALAWDSMKSDAALKDVLFQDLIHLAREKAERVQVPVEWEVIRRNRTSAASISSSPWIEGEVRATEEVFHVVDVTKGKMDYNGNYHPESSPRCMNRYGQ
jgi:hypothetical protein